jgi:hypothetical protein
VPGEESGRILSGVLRDARVPAKAGGQRFLRRSESIEQVQSQLPIVALVVPLQ